MKVSRIIIFVSILMIHQIQLHTQIMTGELELMILLMEEANTLQLKMPQQEEHPF